MNKLLTVFLILVAVNTAVAEKRLVSTVPSQPSCFKLSASQFNKNKDINDSQVSTALKGLKNDVLNCENNGGKVENSKLLQDLRNIEGRGAAACISICSAKIKGDLKPFNDTKKISTDTCMAYCLGDAGINTGGDFEKSPEIAKQKLY